MVALATNLAPLLSQAQTAPTFAPRTMPNHVYDGGWEHFVGGGLAGFDCNGDDLPELYAAGGVNPAQLFINTSNAQGLSYRTGPPDALALTGVIGAYPLDIDGDGTLDLAILRVGPDVLMRGLGDCRFAPFEGTGFQSDDHWSTAFSATFEVGNSLPTLAFGTYVNRNDPNGPFEACDATLLYRPQGGHYIAARTVGAGVLRSLHALHRLGPPGACRPTN